MMSLQLRIFLVLTIIFSSLFLAGPIQARTTPEDIVNSKREAYQAKVKNYSPTHQQQLESMSKQIAAVNQRQSKELENIMIRQGEILNEYKRRVAPNSEDCAAYGCTSKADPLQYARYYITYAHEAVAYQAAKIYIIELSSEANIKQDSLRTISTMEADLQGLRTKVSMSQSLIAKLVKNQ